MRNIKTKYIKTAMFNIAMRIRSDLVMQVAFEKTKSGGNFYIWITEAGALKTIWSLKFYEGGNNIINLPVELTTEKD
jgi:hypothetical protein